MGTLRTDDGTSLSTGAANGWADGLVGTDAQVTSVGEAKTTSGQPLPVRSNSWTLVCR